MLAALLAAGVPLLGAAGQVCAGSWGLARTVEGLQSFCAHTLRAELPPHCNPPCTRPCCAARRLLPRHGPAHRGLALRAGHGPPGLRVRHCGHRLQVRFGARARACVLAAAASMQRGSHRRLRLAHTMLLWLPIPPNRRHRCAGGSWSRADVCWTPWPAAPLLPLIRRAPSPLALLPAPPCAPWAR